MPVCGGDMVKTPFGYGCANYKKDDPESCRFSVGQIAGVKLKEAQVKELLTNGKTGVIEGFIAKTGMKFDAPLKLTKEGRSPLISGETKTCRDNSKMSEVWGTLKEKPMVL